MHERELDIVIFGASGLVGRYAIENLVRSNCLENLELNWAICGRSRKRLMEVLHVVGKKTGENLSGIPIIVTDASDENKLIAMCRRTSVLINLVGPLRTLGEQVVKACLLTGTHYVDTCIEPQFVDSIIVKYTEAARECGSVIITSCGFRTMIIDLATQLMTPEFGTLMAIESHIKLIPGSFGYVLKSSTFEAAFKSHGHVWEVLSTRLKLLNWFPKKLADYKFKLRAALIPRRPLLMETGFSAYAPAMNFLNFDTTNLLNYNLNHKRPVHHCAYYMVPSLKYLIGFGLIGLTSGLLSLVSCGRSLLTRYSNFLTFGLVTASGPTEEQVSSTKFEITLKAIGWLEKFCGPISEQPKLEPNRVIYGLISGPEPTYMTTGICVAQSALTLIRESSKFKVGGILTPGVAFQNTNLMRRLELFRIKYDVRPQLPTETLS
ncbi:Saccharopine dehydrogenase-like oxidoreductase [Halotydeus destructor]|nr:Saccharopine dehydrogenase-like oxidoreductase [Halotydeus destructor]